jgi:hypothetical protein
MIKSLNEQLDISEKARNELREEIERNGTHVIELEQTIFDS